VMSPCRTGSVESLSAQMLTRHALAEKSAKSADQYEMHVTASQVHTHAPAGSRFHSGDYCDDSDAGGPAGNDDGNTHGAGCGRCRIESAQSW
jgi:hypothetical protein